MTATKRYFPMVLILMLYKVVLAVEHGDEMLAVEQYLQVMFFSFFNYAIQGSFNF